MTDRSSFLNSFLVSDELSISDALKKIDGNKSKIVFVKNKDNQLIGSVTDGDIRRWLIKNPDISVNISTCMNRDFVSVGEFTPREKILKLLDHRIAVIPRLSKSKELTEIITRRSFPLESSKRVFARSRSPVRISFGGGGTDLTHYFVEKGGAVMNATIRMYSHATLKKRNDDLINIYSDDLKKHVSASSFSDLIENKKGEIDLILSVLELIKPNFGFDLQIGSEFPVGSGLGGSAVVLSAVIGCFNQFREDKWDNYEIAEMAFQAERIFLELAGGWQDQYATVFGGFNFMEFNHENNIVHPLRIPEDIIAELEQSLILCYSGSGHESDDIHDDQKKQLEKREDIQNLVVKNKELTYQMKALLLKGKLHQFGEALDQAWQLKRQFSTKISNGKLDQLYNLAKESGAIGGKLLGAGGGGYFLFYVKPFYKYQLIERLKKNGYLTHPVLFEDYGLKSWTVREDNHLGEWN